MAYSELQALVVESSFSSRRDIVSSLKETGIVQSIHEAQSVDDGLIHLGLGATDTCLVGPTLSTSAAVTFVRSGTELLVAKGKESRPCAFIAVTKDGAPVAPELLEAGVVEMLSQPFEPKSFSTIVQSAVGKARERWEHLFLEAPGAGISQTVDMALPALSEVLREVAQRLRIVGQDITGGRLSIGYDGRPSLAARDAMRLAIEAALPANSAANEIGSYDNLFVSALVEWFVDRSETTPKNATVNLKRKLLSYSSIRRG